MTTKALNNKVLVIVHSPGQECMKGGIVLVASKNEMRDSGEVYLVGPKVENIKPGDTVYFAPMDVRHARNIGGKTVFAIMEPFIDAVEKAKVRK